MTIKCVWEHNGNDTLLYADNFVGAYTRGENLSKALGKMEAEISAYLRWLGEPVPENMTTEIVQESACTLQISDADSEVIFNSERAPLSPAEYERLKALALKSARDLHELYSSVPDIDKSCLPERTTFYGSRPRTAREMYEHTRSVNSYYFAEIGTDADNSGSIFECRLRGFTLLEQQADHLTAPAAEGSYGEFWSLRKVLRRFIWHDRIHAKAMLRMAESTFGHGSCANPFKF